VVVGASRALILAGTHDPIVPAANSRRLALLLTSRGVDATLVEIAAGHELTREDVARGRDWLGVE
jgi:phospholipase/carboxylesterase